MSQLIKKLDMEIEDAGLIREVFGSFDRNLRLIKDELDVSMELRDNTLSITGEEKMVSLTQELLVNLSKVLEDRETLDSQDIRSSIDLLINKEGLNLKSLLNHSICKNSKGRDIKAKTWGQRRYIDAMENKEIVFAIGPAGTGKTYLAMAMAADALKNKRVSRIIITRPVVEAGENLGFLPGDLQDKVDPYLRPIYDALFDILGLETYEKYMERGLIEIAPLAYMRGRTLESSYIILDEAQNTTNEQMKMLLTRLGAGSRLVVTGDITQIDLVRHKDSGLRNIDKILKDIDGIDFIYLSKQDIVRHRIVQRIVDAYERYEGART